MHQLYYKGYLVLLETGLVNDRLRWLIYIENEFVMDCSNEKTAFRLAKAIIDSLPILKHEYGLKTCLSFKH